MLRTDPCSFFPKDAVVFLWKHSEEISTLFQKVLCDAMNLQQAMGVGYRWSALQETNKECWFFFWLDRTILDPERTLEQWITTYCLPTKSKGESQQRYTQGRVKPRFWRLNKCPYPPSHDPNNRATVCIFIFFLRGQKLGLLTIDQSSIP